MSCSDCGAISCGDDVALCPECLLEECNQPTIDCIAQMNFLEHGIDLNDLHLPDN